MIYVAAANYHHFIFWCRENNKNPNRDAKYINSVQTLMGLGLRPEGNTFVLYETWIGHPEWYEISHQIEFLESLRK